MRRGWLTPLVFSVDAEAALKYFNGNALNGA